MDTRRLTYRTVGDAPTARRLPDVLRDNLLLFLALALLLGVTAIHPERMTAYPRFVDWRAMVTLTGLLILTTGLRESGLFRRLSQALLAHVGREDTLALLLVVTAAGFSMVLTNDITLFIVVPLTLAVEEVSGREMTKTVVFEALAVNAGSSLTPIGNPQNIFLWHRWGITFTAFVGDMLPLAAVSLVLLLLLTSLSFGRERVRLNHLTSPRPVDRRLALVSSLGLVGYLAAVETHRALYALPLVLAAYLLLFRPTLRRVDWPLLALFLVLFIDSHLLAEIPFVRAALFPWTDGSTAGLYLLGIGLSQAVSNVPAALLLAHFSHDWRTIAYAVNVGGNGLVIGSLANLIALRMTGRRRAWGLFHRYSLPYLLLLATAAYALV